MEALRHKLLAEDKTSETERKIVELKSVRAQLTKLTFSYDNLRAAFVALATRHSDSAAIDLTKQLQNTKKAAQEEEAEYEERVRIAEERIKTLERGPVIKTDADQGSGAGIERWQDVLRSVREKTEECETLSSRLNNLDRQHTSLQTRFSSLSSSHAVLEADHIASSSRTAKILALSSQLAECRALPAKATAETDGRKQRCEREAIEAFTRAAELEDQVERVELSACESAGRQEELEKQIVRPSGKELVQRLGEGSREGKGSAAEEEGFQRVDDQLTADLIVRLVDSEVLAWT
ncbi:hypothetical protein JCM8547_003857 [Rhodosporidiobolus lusitaniae]